MTLIIEDGSLVTNANSYITEAELTQYAVDRGYTLTGTLEPFLIRSFDFMSGLSWCTPHTAAYTVTQAIKSAQAEVAYRISVGVDPSATPSSGGIKREKVDVLEVEYFDAPAVVSNPDDFLKTIPTAYAFIKDLICSTSSTGYGSKTIIRA